MLLVPVVLFAVALVGHLFLGLRVYNWCYGRVVNEHLSDAVRNVLSVVIAVLPFGYLWFFGPDGWTPLTDRNPVALYLVVCWATMIIYPVLQAAYWSRRRFTPVTSNHTRTVDVAAELKQPCLGRYKQMWLAKLPRNEICQADLVEKTLHLARFPKAWDGLTILHLSDLHFCGSPDRNYFEHVVGLCNEWRPDLIALTGDVVDSEEHYRWIVPVLGRLRCNVAAFAILGNHDYRYDVEKVRKRLRRVGMRVLVNDWTTLDVRGEPLVVVGHEGPWLSPPPAMGGCPPGPFRLGLSHTPDNIAWAQRHHIDLMLSGHVHGGQIRLPLVGSVFVPSRYGRKYDAGTFREGRTLLHVSRGLGGEHPVRYGCRPEVTLLKLRRSPERQQGKALAGAPGS